MAEEIRLVGVFTDDITPKLKKLSKSINDVVKSFTKIQKKLRPIVREMGMLAMASERVATALKAQKTAIDMNSRSWSNYKKEVGQAAGAARKAFKGVPKGGAAAPRLPKGGGGGAGRGIGIGGVAVGGALGGILSTAIIRGFEAGVQLMMKPFQMFASAFAERMGDEMADIQSAGGMMALDQKDGAKLFGGDFTKARGMQERLNSSLAESAAALPGATNDYVRAARGITDTVMMAFGKNEQAFKEFAVELGANSNATSEEAITKVLSRFTEQTVLLGMGGSKGGMPLTMLMEQLVTQESVNVQGMKRRYAQLRQNPLLATMLEGAQAEINKAGAGTAGRMKAVMKALDDALPQQVVNAMRRSMDGLVEATRSAFFDPDTGLFGLSRKIKVMVDGVEIETSLFEEIRSIAANLFVPVMELLTFLSDVFDPFENLLPILNRFRQDTKIFFDQFEGMSKWFENESKSMFDRANLLTDPQAQTDLRRQAELLKRQAGPRGALAALNQMLGEFGVITEGDFQKNLARLTDTSVKGLQFDFSDMAVSMLKGLAASPMIQELVNTIGEVLGTFVATIFKAIDNILKSVSSDEGTGNKLIDGFVASFTEGLGGVDVKGILSNLFDKIIGAVAKAFVEYGLPAIFGGLGMLISGTWDAGIAGKALVVVGGLMALFNVVTTVIGVMTALQAGLALISGLKIGATIAGWLGAVGPAIASLKAGLLAIAGAFKAAFLVVLAPILAVAGAVMIVIAVVRNFGSILEAMGGAINYMIGALEQGIGGLLSGLGGFIKGLPFMKERGEGLEKSGNALSAGGRDKTDAAAARMDLAGKAIVAQTAKDFDAINKTLGIGQKEQTKATQEVAEALKKVTPNTAGGKAAGMEWYNKQMGTSTPATSPAPTPPNPVVAAAAAASTTQLPKIAASTAQVPAKVNSVAVYLKTLCDKVDLHGKATTAKLTEVKSQIAASSNNIQARMGEISTRLDSGINVKIVGTPTVIAKMDISGLGGGTGGPSMFTTAAAGFGLQMTSGYRPGDDDSYHGMDRARDYAGDPQNMKKFASFMAASYGGSLKELIYTPLGYSISNGQVVAPYATSTHYDHVHVAYANGLSKPPSVFGSQNEAMSFEAANMPFGAAVASVTANSSEFKGQPTYNQSVTVNISGAGMNDDELSNMVAGRVLSAMQQATFTELDVT